MITLTSGDSLGRTSGGFLDNSANWQITLWVMLKANSSVDRVYHTLFTVDGDYTEPYIQLKSKAGSPNTLLIEYLDVADGTPTLSSHFILYEDVWYPIAIGYVASSEQIKICPQTKSRISITWTGIASIVWASEYLGDPSGVNELNIGYYRSYPTNHGTVLDGDNWRDDFAAAVGTGTRFADTPLDADPNDVSGNSRNWVESGSPVYSSGLPQPSSTIIVNEFRDLQSNNGSSPAIGWAQPTIPLWRIQTGVLEDDAVPANMMVCGNGIYNTQFGLGNVGPEQGTIRFRYQCITNRVSGGTSLVLVQNYTTFGTVSLSINLAHTFADGSGTLQVIKGVTAVNVTIPAGTFPSDGIETVGVQLVWDATSSPILADVYVNDVNVASISTVDPGLTYKCWNIYTFTGVANTLSGLKTNHGFSDLTLKDVAEVISWDGGSNDALPLALHAVADTNCCHVMPDIILGSLEIDCTTGIATITGGGFVPKGINQISFTFEGPDGEELTAELISMIDTEAIYQLELPIVNGIYCITKHPICV